MKKLDFVMIILVLLIGVSVFLIYFKKYNVNTNNARVEIYYQNLLIDSIIYEEGINYTYTITTVDNNTLKVIKNDNGDEESKYYNVEQPKHIYNEISITYEKIKMVHANCENKKCLDMVMTRTYTLPIICTNGIAVMFVPNGELDGIVP